MNLQCLGILLWHQCCYFSQESASLLQENSSSVEWDEHVIAMAQGLGNVAVFSSGWFALNVAVQGKSYAGRGLVLVQPSVGQPK